MSWLLSVNDIRPLQAVFGDVSAISSLVDLHEITVHRRGREVRLRFDLQDFPADPPPKWRAENANTVQVVLSLIGLRALNISGILTNVLGTVHVERDAAQQRVVVRFDSDELHLYAEGVNSAIATMTAFQVRA